LDVVVRHKGQSLATNLKASDFTVHESGVPQTILSFRLAVGGEARGFAPPSPPAASPGAIAAAQISAREPNSISIVFDQVGADSRQNALEADTVFPDQELKDNTKAAIIDGAVRVERQQWLFA
jgi:hypothetical protein